MMWDFLHRLASPPGFNRFADATLPWFFAAWLLTFVSGLYWALVVAPPDYQQGDAYRIIFIHVPAAWMSLFVYTAMTITGVIGAVWTFKLSDVFIRAAAPLGVLFTFITLLTGSIWGKPMWGTWWEWDARLTSELILLFIYIGFIVLQHSFDDFKTRSRINAVVLMIGFVNIPIIHFSVDWWTSLHQPASILKLGKPSIHSSMLYPLLWMALSFKLFFASAILYAMQTEVLQSRRGKAALAAG